MSLQLSVYSHHNKNSGVGHPSMHGRAVHDDDDEAQNSQQPPVCSEWRVMITAAWVEMSTVSSRTLLILNEWRKTCDR